ncbi:MAG: hypothetical protein ABIP33_07400, partial [Pseudolysinimonas sp.]
MFKTAPLLIAAVAVTVALAGCAASAPTTDHSSSHQAASEPTPKATKSAAAPSGVIPVDATVVDADRVRYYTETPSYSTLPDWLRDTIEREATSRRFAAA